jgi:CBS domain-containing protein
LRSSEEQSNVRIEKIMSTNVITLDVSKTAAHAASLMTEKRIGSVVVTKNNKAFGIVTERDLLRRYFRNTLLESLASHPLITAELSTTVQKAVEIMLKNSIRKLPIVDANEALVGIVTETDLAMFLLPGRKPGLTSSILRTVSRGKAPACDSCNTTTDIQWCDSCNRFMCLACEDQIHSVDLP